MGADIKSLRIRIRSVDSTMHLTKAMGLVASSKIRRATRDMTLSREYSSAMQDVVNVLRAAPECERSPYMKPTGTCTRLIVIAGDRGQASVSSERFPAAEAKKLADAQCRDFLEGKFERLGILYTRYKSMMSQEATVLWVLPLEKTEKTEGGDPLFEPDEQTVLNAAVPTYVSGILSACIKESFASEVAARRMAMDSASKNAQEMIDRLQLQYNRARQNSITQEITEIVAGSGL